MDSNPEQNGEMMITTTIKLPQSLLAKIDGMAESDYRSRSNLIFKILDEYVSKAEALS